MIGNVTRSVCMSRSCSILCCLRCRDAFDLAVMTQTVLAQHAVGGLLCVPSLVVGVTPMSSALVRQGAMCELGWEVQDVVCRAYQIILGGRQGRRVNPLPLVVSRSCKIKCTPCWRCVPVVLGALSRVLGSQLSVVHMQMLRLIP